MRAEHQHFVETALGWIGLVASAKGLKAVLGPRDTLAEVQRESMEAFGPLAEDREGPLAEIARGLERYARRESGASFDWALDMDDGTPFQRAVWDALRAIPPGEVRTYGQIAAAIGRPGAARAVGQAVGANPFTIVVPCHRVVGSDGALTGFGGGLATKERLLLREGRTDAPLQRRRTERRKGFRPTLRERGLRRKRAGVGR